MKMLKVFAVGFRLVLVNLGKDPIKYGFVLDSVPSETNGDSIIRYLDTVLVKDFFLFAV